MAGTRAVCPGCRMSISVDPHIEAGEWVNCPRCKVDLEVISLNPLALDWADDGLEKASIAWARFAGTRRGGEQRRSPRINPTSYEDEPDLMGRSGHKPSRRERQLRYTRDF